MIYLKTKEKSTKQKFCPFVRKKCLKEKCRCFDADFEMCNFFDAVDELWKISKIDDALEMQDDVLEVLYDN